MQTELATEKAVVAVEAETAVVQQEENVDQIKQNQEK